MAQAKLRPTQTQPAPGDQDKMRPKPVEIRSNYKGSDKLKDKVALITGGDSGIGRSVAIHFAREGADVAIVYLSETKDAKETAQKIQEEGRKAILMEGDVGSEGFCREAVERVIEELLDILVNNAAEQQPQESIDDISAEQLDKVFHTNVFSMFYLVKAALAHLKKGACILNTTSITSYRGSEELLDYSATKGAVTAFTRSLSQALIDKKIRVNGVAPGPIWTPLIPSTFPPDEVAKFGADTPMGRAGEPAEVAPCYVFLASDDASYITGQVLHPNGGTVINT